MEFIGMGSIYRPNTMTKSNNQGREKVCNKPGQNQQANLGIIKFCDHNRPLTTAYFRDHNLKSCLL